MRDIFKKYTKYISYIIPYIKFEVAIFILISISSVVALANPVLLQVIIDRVLLMKQIELLKYVIGTFLAFYILGTMIQYANGFLNTYIGQHISTKLRMNLLKHIQKSKIEELIESKNGDLLTKITDDVSTVTGFLTGTFVSIVSYILNILASAGFMLFYSVKLAVVAFIVATVQLFISLKFSKITRENQKEIRQQYSLHLSFLSQFLGSFKHIKAYGSEKSTERKYLKILRNLVNLSFKNFHIYFSYGTLMSFVSFLGSILIFSIGVYEIFNGGMTIGALFVFDIVSERFYQFATGFVDLNVSLQGAFVAVERLESIFSLEIEKEEDADSKSILNCNNIRVQNVDFRYNLDNETNILRNVSFEFEKGRSYALLGASGDGKSTIVNLLLRFYHPQQGEILIDGNNINNINLKKLRKHMSVVFQDPLLVDSSIEDNIRFGNTKASFEEVQRVAEICSINEFILTLPDGYKSNVGEVGEKLSGGQKQRICIARALLKDSDIYIFDEAFSNMDKNLEYDIFSKLQKELSDKITIYISHNVNLIKSVEEIIVFNRGEVEAIGNHEHLLKLSSVYKELLKKGAKDV